MDFFTSPEDLKGWVQVQESSDTAATKLMDIVGLEEEQDIVDTCRSIYHEKEDMAENASKILFGVLAKHNITQIREGNMKNDQIKREAQGIYRGEAALYQSMPLRICPKLPVHSNINPSAGRAISTLHCRENCLDSLTFDDDPLRVYCAETLWRRHVMDKFSREWRNKDGKLVGGYINERFQVYHDDSGNKMSLSRDERSRLPRKHQYSTERRLEESRGEETTDITASSKPIIKLASTEAMQNNDDDRIYQIFNDIIDMKEASISDEDILYKVAEHYKISIFNVAKIKKLACSQLSRHNGVRYASDNSMTMTKSAQMLPQNSTMLTKTDAQVINMANGEQVQLKIETPVVLVSNDPTQESIFEIVDGPDAGSRFQLTNDIDKGDLFGIIDDIQPAAEEIGLNEELSQPQINEELSQPQSSPENFPIEEE